MAIAPKTPSVPSDSFQATGKFLEGQIVANVQKPEFILAAEKQVGAARKLADNRFV